MSKYVVYKKEGNYQIPSNDIIFNDLGVWINDNLEYNLNDRELFIPYHNISQIVKYKEEKENDNI